jgi:hypothetical protein
MDESEASKVLVSNDAAKGDRGEAAASRVKLSEVLLVPRIAIISTARWCRSLTPPVPPIGLGRRVTAACSGLARPMGSLERSRGR